MKPIKFHLHDLSSLFCHMNNGSVDKNRNSCIQKISEWNSCGSTFNAKSWFMVLHFSVFALSLGCHWHQRNGKSSYINRYCLVQRAQLHWYSYSKTGKSMYIVQTIWNLIFVHKIVEHNETCWHNGCLKTSISINSKCFFAFIFTFAWFVPTYQKMWFEFSYSFIDNFIKKLLKNYYKSLCIAFATKKSV